ncbi:MAG: ATP-binding protein [Cyclobacteriaceae bacterium]|nr:ATP-binding protein [Cyclobacteriaceae bacterium]MDH4298734.1 ATP-binding protein [Cyclobacteriaceae bacterium]MDH5248440.1 ATP-binding protein [Cyclobacteriaceae bacterium]
MITRFLFLAGILFVSLNASAQTPEIDSLHRLLATNENDTVQMLALSSLSQQYSEMNPDSSLYFSTKLLAVSRKLRYKLNEVDALVQMGYALLNLGDYPRSLQTFLPALEIAEDPASESHVLPGRYVNLTRYLPRPVTPHILRLDMLAQVHHYIGILYGNTNSNTKALYHDHKALELNAQTHNDAHRSIVCLTLGRVYLAIHKADSALMFERMAYDLALKSGFTKYLGSILLNLGRIYLAQGDEDQASIYFKKALVASREQNYLRGVVAGNLLLSDLYRNAEKSDSSLYYANEALSVAALLTTPDLLVRSYRSLAAYYQSTHQRDSTVKYLQLVIRMNDNLFDSKQAQQFQRIDFDAQQRQQELDAAEKTYQNRMLKYWLVAGVVGFGLIVFFLLRDNRQRKKSNSILQKQKKEIETALADLKNAQKLLVQSEKMASLGELTAGIAHEIQNPLNFVNNFSEVNSELIDELVLEAGKGNVAEITKIATSIKENEQKIVHHGKRADAIVKGMLQHSRSSSGAKEPTDINILAEEYLRLAFHGLRAKEKSFNASMKTEFDETIGKINIIPQDIGRVILNLITNAFYAVSAKALAKGQIDYQPTVMVSTKKVGNQITVSVSDNGNGIPGSVVDKIFQPFFTTKPTGQGTGLGLSLSYDIVKAHGGTLKLETKEGEGSKFIIQLPVV